jgi:orotidine-5'-phosphate decarboxylase
MKRNPIIVALDVETADEARSLVARIGPAAEFYKVGMELYASAGVEYVRELIGEGKHVFLDLKFYDIGETVRRAVAQVSRLGVRFLTIHAVGQVMRAAVEGRGDSGLKLLGVTVLTSFDQHDLEEDGYSISVPDLVKRRVELARKAGVDGIVASPLEAANVRAVTGPDAIVVTPGVRSAGTSKGDQKRVATPAEAMRNGADYLVIGRQITRAADPAAEARRVLEEVAEV